MGVVCGCVQDNVHANLSVATMIWDMLSNDQKPTSQFSFQYLRALQVRTREVEWEGFNDEEWGKGMILFHGAGSEER